ncbi:Cmx/CmrA family chloramphenicol efflux MFS transporter [Saccharopolyspora taberi]|uniref:MFS transporter n=1 Tax=Saccharopolyspora taberi TaxID=60895 RepID=A0ABN3VDE2_9PSEU
MPLAIFVLGLTVFCVGTTEFVISGLLPLLAADFQVSVPTAGLLISGYALGVVVGGPLLTLALLRVRRKAALLLLLGLFLLGQTLGALAPTYPVLMFARVVTALAQGAFFGIGSVVAVGLAGPERRGRALAIMFGGLTLANVLGVPIGTFLGQQWGWRASFWVIDALALAGLIGVLVLVPAQPRPRGTGVRAEFASFANPRVWTALAVTALSQAGLFALVSYLAPLLTEVSGFGPAMVPVLQLLFGLGCLAGTAIGGRFADAHLRPNLVVGLAGLTIVLGGLTITSGDRITAAITLVLLGVAAFAINPALQALVMIEAADAPTLATTTNTSAFNVGNTIGPWAGGLVINAGFGFAAPAWVGALFAAGALAVVCVDVRLGRQDRALAG